MAGGFDSNFTLGTSKVPNVIELNLNSCNACKKIKVTYQVLYIFQNR